MNKILASIVVLMAGTASADETIKLHHAFQAGDKMTYEVSAFQMAIVTKADGPTKRYLEGKGKFEHVVKSVGPKGGALDLVLKVTRFELRDSPKGEFKPSGLAGATIAVSRKPPEVTFKREGGELSEQEHAILRLIYTTKSDDETQDDKFSPGKPIAIGGSWSPNKDRMAISLGKALRTKISVEAINSDFTLVEKQKVSGVDCLFIRGSFGAKDVALPQAGKGTLKANLEGCFSKDGVRYSGAMIMQMDLQIGKEHHKLTRAVRRTILNLN